MLETKPRRSLVDRSRRNLGHDDLYGYRIERIKRGKMKIVDPDGVIVGFVKNSGKGGSTPWSATCFRGLTERPFKSDYGNPTEAGSNVIAVHRGWLERNDEHAEALANYHETDGETLNVARLRTRLDVKPSVEQDPSTSVPAARRVKIDRELEELLKETPKEEKLPQKTTMELANELSLNGADHENEEVRVETLARRPTYRGASGTPRPGSPAEDTYSRSLSIVPGGRPGKCAPFTATGSDAD